jgi:hypothetical protein
MTLDEKIRTTLERAASDIPYIPATSPAEIARRGRRRWTRRRAGWGLASVVVVLGVLTVTIPFDPNPRTPATTANVATVEIGDLAVAVTGSEPVLRDPDVWLGLPGPDPLFDTSPLGPDLSFAPGEPSTGDLDEENMRHDGWPSASRGVYLGELAGEPFYIFSAPAPSIWDRIFEVINGNFSGDTLGTSLNCCTGGDMDHGEWLPGISGSFSSEGGVMTSEVITAEWLGLSTEVSVVAYQVDGEFMGWQTPVGGVSSLRLDRWPNEYLGVAFDATGRELNRFGAQLEPLLDEGLAVAPEAPEGTLPPGADWAPMTTDGSEISADEIPSDELRERIAPRPGDRLFLVLLDGGEVVIRVRDSVAHAYAASCDVLGSVDLPPAWEKTCLG